MINPTNSAPRLVTSVDGHGTWVNLHLEAPTSYQWAAIGTGHKMDGSFMIVMQPSGTDSGKQDSILFEIVD